MNDFSTWRLKETPSCINLSTFSKGIPVCSTQDECFHTLGPLSATRVSRSDDRRRISLRADKLSLSLSLSLSSHSADKKITSPVVGPFPYCRVHYVGNRLYEMSRATKRKVSFEILCRFQPDGPRQIRSSVTIMSSRSNAPPRLSARRAVERGRTQRGRQI